MISGTSVTVPARADNYETEKSLVHLAVKDIKPDWRKPWLNIGLVCLKQETTYLASWIGTFHFFIRTHPFPSPAHHPTMEGYPT